MCIFEVVVSQLLRLLEQLLLHLAQLFKFLFSLLHALTLLLFHCLLLLHLLLLEVVLIFLYVDASFFDSEQQCVLFFDVHREGRERYETILNSARLTVQLPALIISSFPAC